MTTDSIIKLFDRLKSARATMEQHWQEIADYFMPTKNTITKVRTSGSKLDTDKYDSTPIDSLQVFAAGLHGYLTNPSMRWFNLTLKEKELLHISNVCYGLIECFKKNKEKSIKYDFNEVVIIIKKNPFHKYLIYRLVMKLKIKIKELNLIKIGIFI